MNLKIIFSVCCLILIASCASRLNTVSPDSVDLSGVWLLDQAKSQTVILGGQFNNATSRAMAGTGMGSAGAVDSTSAPNPIGFGGGPQLTRAMKATEMAIEQNHDSMGIDYPNEQYRDIDWGEKEFYRETVTAGWRDNTLIVKSVGRQMIVTETYQLNATRDVLTLTLLIKDQRGKNEFVRIFNLQKSP